MGKASGGNGRAAPATPCRPGAILVWSDHGGSVRSRRHSIADEHCVCACEGSAIGERRPLNCGEDHRRGVIGVGTGALCSNSGIWQLSLTVSTASANVAEALRPSGVVDDLRMRGADRAAGAIRRGIYITAAYCHGSRRHSQTRRSECAVRLRETSRNRPGRCPPINGRSAECSWRWLFGRWLMAGAHVRSRPKPAPSARAAPTRPPRGDFAPRGCGAYAETGRAGENGSARDAHACAENRRGILRCAGEVVGALSAENAIRNGEKGARGRIIKTKQQIDAALGREAPFERGRIVEKAQAALARPRRP